MVTQTLRGMATHGALHSRGDRVQRLLRRRPVRAESERLALRRGSLVPELHRGVPGPRRARRADLRGPDAGVRGLRAAAPDAAERRPESRQLAHDRAAERVQHLGRSSASSTDNTNNNQAQPVQRLPHDRSGEGLLRHQLGEIQGRRAAAELQDPAPAQHVHEGRDVRTDHGRSHATSATRFAAGASSTTARSTR